MPRIALSFFFATEYTASVLSSIMTETEDSKMEKSIRSCAMLCAIILLAGLIIAVIPTEAEASIYNDTVRLHILANSDSEEDQSIKLLLRDFLLAEYDEYLSCAKSKGEAEAMIGDILPEIEAEARGFLSSIGCEDGVRVDMGTEWFGTREYESFSLPEGYYTSLIVRIGKAEGQNWWCVMYPPMCLGVAVSSPNGYTKEEERLITSGKRNIKFKLLEVISRALK